MKRYRNATGGLRGNGVSLEPPNEPDYSDLIASRVSALGFFKLREFSRDYRDDIKRIGVIEGFRRWLAEKIDRQIDEEAAKSWEDSREYFE